MIANFFNKTKPVIVVNLLILFTILYLLSNFLTQNIELSLISIASKIGLLFGFIFMLFVVNFILRKNNLTEDNSYSLLIFILFLSSFNETFYSEKLFFSNLFLLFAFRKIYSLNSGFNTIQKLFDAGLWIGLSTLIYQWSVLFFLLIYLAMFIYRNINFKNLFVPILGFISPVIIFFTYHFYNDNLNVFYSSFNFEYGLDFQNYNSLKILIPLTLLITLLIWCIINLIPKIVLTSKNFKAAWQILIIHLIISIIIIIAAPLKHGSELFFIFLPTAIVITIYLQKTTSNIFKNMILYFILVVALGVYFL